MHRRDLGMVVPGTRRRARAFAQCRSMRHGSVAQAAQHEPAVEGRRHGAAVVAARAGRAANAASSARDDHARRPRTSLWPPRYLVVACMTRSAPSASGRCSAGVAKVLSHDARARRRAARSPPTAAMSTTLQQRVRRRLDPDEARRRPQRARRARRGSSCRRRSPAAPTWRTGRAARSRCRGRRRRGATTWSPGARRLEDRAHRGRHPDANAAPLRRPRARRAPPRAPSRFGLPVARVDVAVRVPAVGVALEGRRQVDRRRHRAGRRIDPVPGVHGDGLEAAVPEVLHRVLPLRASLCGGAGILRSLRTTTSRRATARMPA